MDRKEQIEQEELERLESNAGVYDDDFVDEYAYIDQEEAEEDRKEILTPKHLNYLKCVLISQLLLEANDDLKGSKAFKQNVKYQVGKTNQILEQGLPRGV